MSESSFTSSSLSGGRVLDVLAGAQEVLDEICEFALHAFVFVILPLFLVRFSWQSSVYPGDIGAAALVHSKG